MSDGRPPGAEMLEEQDLPGLYRAADDASNRAQRRHFLATRSQLLLVVAAAGLSQLSIGSTGDVEVGQLAAAAAFVIAAIVRGSMAATRSDDVWYASRALAESVKTLAWRYAVGGDPFRVDQASGHEADRLFVARLREVVHKLQQFPVVPAQAAANITAGMQSLRSAPLTGRRSAYLQARVADQRGWYSRKARWNQRRANVWNAVTLCLEVSGAVFALLVGIGAVEFDIVSLTATLVGAATAWATARQHRALRVAYSVAAEELSILEDGAHGVQTEEAWAEYVEEVEQAISREHTVWIGAKKL